MDQRLLRTCRHNPVEPAARIRDQDNEEHPRARLPADVACSAMTGRRAFLMNAPLGFLGLSAACADRNESARNRAVAAGAVPTPGTRPAALLAAVPAGAPTLT